MGNRGRLHLGHLKKIQISINSFGGHLEIGLAADIRKFF